MERAKHVVSLSSPDLVIHWEEKKSTDRQHQEVEAKKHIDSTLRGTHHIHL